MPEAVAEEGVACAGGDGGAACAGAGTAPADGVGRAFRQVSAVADAVLYEGYLLYPYRRSSPKNRVRWQFGVLLPRDWAERDGPVVPGVSGSAESWYQQTECLLRPGRPGALVRIVVRYLQTQHKQVEAAGGEGRHRPVQSLRTGDGTAHLSFDEAVPREAALDVPLEDLLEGEHVLAVEAAAGEETTALPEGAGRVVRRRQRVRARTVLAAERLPGGVCRLRVRTENTGRAGDPRAPREEVLRRALLATHTLLGGEGLEFLSLIDPPADLAEHARACRNAFTFPVLGGEPPAGGPAAAGPDGGTASVVLSAPIILPDRPRVAPESPGDLHDAAEIDEILTLRTLLLTDEEKREARATDARAARILDRVETMPPEVLGRLHGAIRSLAPAGPGRAVPGAATAPAGGGQAPPATAAGGRAAPAAGDEAPAARTGTPPGAGAPGDGTRGPLPPPAAPAERPAWWHEGADEGLSPATDPVVVNGVPVRGGSRVRLCPRGRGADAQDMFLAGRTARVAAVFHDVDGGAHLAVTLDDDPAAELNGWYGRFHYFRPEEVRPIQPGDGAGDPPAPAPAAP
ncbi:hypothetical protein ABZ920_02165 [Streptomyces sp. NPDC046831]|uniref:hypothetical protein n=1 Tax=Streptomyces sp. NPDC046831 TaxID=3154805 RepID=UPI00340DC336